MDFDGSRRNTAELYRARRTSVVHGRSLLTLVVLGKTEEFLEELGGAWKSSVEIDGALQSSTQLGKSRQARWTSVEVGGARWSTAASPAPPQIKLSDILGSFTRGYLKVTITITCISFLDDKNRVWSQSNAECQVPWQNRD